MNREEAKTKVMTIYGSLSEELKQAIDVLVDAPNCERGKAEGINIHIPEGATNGDVMELLFNIPPDWIKYCDEYYAPDVLAWWNAPYKQEEQR